MTKIHLEVTEDEAGVLLAALLDERVRLRKFVDRRKAWVRPVSQKTLEGLDALDRLVGALKHKLGRLRTARFGPP